jgi:hypothetical protein
MQGLVSLCFIAKCKAYRPQDCDEVKGIYGIMNDFSTIAAPGPYLADTFLSQHADRDQTGSKMLHKTAHREQIRGTGSQ